MMNATPATASQNPGSQQNKSKNDNKFDSYLMYDFSEFQGLVHQPDSNQIDGSPTNSKQRNMGQNDPTVQKHSSQQENLSKLEGQYQDTKNQEDDKKNHNNFDLGLIDKSKDKNQFDEFYTFLMSLDFLNISNTRNRVDPILMSQFESLLKIKEYFVMLKNHIEKITENDSDLWFDELKNTFKLMLHQFENMINSISEQINPVSLSVCFFRCIEYIKFFEQFLHMRTFHQSNTKGQDTPQQKFRRSVRICLLWKKLTGQKTFDQFIDHLDSDPYNCQKCEKCKKDIKNQQLQNQIQMLQNIQAGGEIRSSFTNQQQQTETAQNTNSPNMLAENQGDKNANKNNQQANTNKNMQFYHNSKIFKDLQEGFSKMLEKELNNIKIYKKQINSEQKLYQQQQQQQELKNQQPQFVEYQLANRGNKFRKIISPVCYSYNQKTDFFTS